MSSDSEPSIQDLLAGFLADQRDRLAPRTYRNYEYVVELLSHCLNGSPFKCKTRPLGRALRCLA